MRSDANEEIALVVDPVLPPDFDNCPNERRPQAEVDAWWMNPFVVTLRDGTFELRCLDGGAWDRSTHWGYVQTLEDAKRLAVSKLREVQTSVYVRESGGASLLVLDSTPPRQASPVVMAGRSGAELLQEWDETVRTDPARAHAIARRALHRSKIAARAENNEQFTAFDCDPVDVEVLSLLLALKEPDTMTAQASLIELSWYMNNAVSGPEIEECLTRTFTQGEQLTLIESVGYSTVRGVRCVTMQFGPALH